MTTIERPAVDPKCSLIDGCRFKSDVKNGRFKQAATEFRTKNLFSDVGAAVAFLRADPSNVPDAQVEAFECFVANIYADKHHTTARSHASDSHCRSTSSACNDEFCA